MFKQFNINISIIIEISSKDKTNNQDKNIKLLDFKKENKS